MRRAQRLPKSAAWGACRAPSRFRRSGTLQRFQQRHRRRLVQHSRRHHLLRPLRWPRQSRWLCRRSRSLCRPSRWLCRLLPRQTRPSPCQRCSLRSLALLRPTPKLPPKSASRRRSRCSARRWRRCHLRRACCADGFQCRMRYRTRATTRQGSSLLATQGGAPEQQTTTATPSGSRNRSPRTTLTGKSSAYRGSTGHALVGSFSRAGQVLRNSSLEAAAPRPAPCRSS